MGMQDYFTVEILLGENADTLEAHVRVKSTDWPDDALDDLTTILTGLAGVPKALCARHIILEDRERLGPGHCNRGLAVAFAMPTAYRNEKWAA